MSFHRERPAWATPDDDALPVVHPVVIASDQVTDAMAALDRHPSLYTRWPFAELDALTGPMAPGNIWFVCANSGGGKTTFLASVIMRWRLMAKRVYVMPLETRPNAFRTLLACLETGIHPGDALSGNLRSMPGGDAKRAVLKSALIDQTKPPWVDTVMVSAQRAINLAGLEAGMKEAKAFRADVVIVDHIDHIAGGDGKNLYAEARAVNHGALHMAQDNDLLLLFASQLNASASRGDYLSKYLPPKDEHVAFNQLKRAGATGMIGLFRPLRKRRADESEDQYRDAITAARQGRGDIVDALEPNVMGVNAMKLRNYGAREGAKTYLAVQHGQVGELTERDRWTTDGGRPRQAV